jgi:mitochondrial fission protein ELM1
MHRLQSYLERNMTGEGHVFISYSRRDGQNAATTLENALRDHGYTVWRDIRGIDPARDFTAEIERATRALRHIGTPEALAALEKWRQDQQ